MRVCLCVRVSFKWSWVRTGAFSSVRLLASLVRGSQEVPRVPSEANSTFHEEHENSLPKKILSLFFGRQFNGWDGLVWSGRAGFRAVQGGCGTRTQGHVHKDTYIRTPFFLTLYWMVREFFVLRNHSEVELTPLPFPSLQRRNMTAMEYIRLRMLNSFH